MRPRVLISTGGGDPARYENALRLAGAEPFAAYLPAPDLSWDGLLLAGGGDMDPALFGQADTASRDVDPARDRAELALLDAFLGAGRPVLAVCRGQQVVNVWAGGGLVQDLGPLVPVHQLPAGDAVHPVRAAPGSLLRRLYGPGFPVNSCHHQGVGRLGRGLRATALAPDGTVEALEHDRLPVICVQFHPERMDGSRTVPGAPIFREFAALCSRP